MLRVLLGGLLPVPDEVVRGLLARENAAVLDVGSGSGHWYVCPLQRYSHKLTPKQGPWTSLSNSRTYVLWGSIWSLRALRMYTIASSATLRVPNM